MLGSATRAQTFQTDAGAKPILHPASACDLAAFVRGKVL
jgi:hypothetical protein